jgi:hypothetical protein
MGKFQDYCGKLFGQYNNDIVKITKESTERIFYLIKNQNNEIKYSKKLTIGKFYLIKYDFNDNKLWCPIFLIDDRYKPDIQKRILYAINLDYLPYAYRILFFDILFDSFRSIVEYNENDNIDEEKPFPINFEEIYNLLKKNGDYEYTITAFDYLKIDGIIKGSPKIFSISTNFVPRFVFINTKIVNLKIMKDLSIILDNYNIKNKLNNLIEEFEKIKENIDVNDQKEYYKKLKNLESKYKLFENNKN